MTVRIRFFARFREIFGPEIIVEVRKEITIVELIRAAISDHSENETIFDQNGKFRSYVILMKNGKRIENTQVEEIVVSDGDEIAVFPPVAGG